MAFHTDDFRGTAQDGICFQQESGGKELFSKLKEIVTNEIKERGIPAKIRTDFVKSGGIFGKKCPLLIITHPKHRFFSIGIYVNDVQVFFPLLGESVENTKYNKKKRYEENGNFIKAALVHPDEFMLQQEAAWQRSILACFNDNLRN